MQVHNVVQGSEQWTRYRMEHDNASEAAAMLGLTKKTTRNELLRIKSSGIEKEYSDWVQNVLFEKGHDTEAMARPLIEEMIGEELYSVTCSDGRLSASCDGLTMDDKIAFEHKIFNKELANFIATEGTVPDEYMPQCQQVLMVTGADKLIFATSDGTAENLRYVTILPDAAWQKRIIDGWEQFHKDLLDYVHVEHKEKPIAAAIMQLPALSIQINGEVTVSNLPQFKEAAELFIANIKTDLQTDDDFADAEATVKFCDETEKKLEAAKKAAIGQTASIDELMRTIDHIKESMRVKRLALDKLVKTQKEAIKNKIIDSAYDLACRIVETLGLETGRVKFNDICLSIFSKRDFIESTKNKRTLESLHNAVDTKLAEVTIHINTAAQNVRQKLAWLTETGKESLFPDIQQLVQKPNDDFQLILKTRIEEHERTVAAAAQSKIDDQKVVAELVAKKILDDLSAQIDNESAAEKEAHCIEAMKHATEIQQPWMVCDAETEGVVQDVKDTLVSPVGGDNGLNDVVTITRKEYQSLLDDSHLLAALESAGVDNWDGYETALCILNENQG